MKKGTVRNLCAGGEAFTAEFIGAGMFCKAWRILGTDRVICYTGEDTSKEILSLCNQWNGEVKHIPTVQRIDDSNDEGYIFEMPYYQPLTAKSKEAWKQYRTLETAWREAVKATVPYGKHFHHYGYELNQYIVANADIPDDLRTALETLADTATNFGTEYAFEFAARNLKVDKDGNLILLDVLFNARAVYDMRNKKH